MTSISSATREGYRPTREERQELDESYRELFPDLAVFFTRAELIRLIDRLLHASRRRGRWYRLTDCHRLVLYWCLRTYCDLHNDDATGTGDKVGPYEIERIDLDAILDRFFFAVRDFLMGPPVADGKLEWVTSEVVKFEITRCPDDDRRMVLELLCRSATGYAILSDQAIVRARHLRSQGSGISTRCTSPWPRRPPSRSCSRRMISSSARPEPSSLRRRSAWRIRYSSRRR